MRPFPVTLGFLLLVAAPAAAQLPVFAAGQAGASFDVGSDRPNAGAGFAWQGAVGVRLPRVAFGGEYGRYTLGGGRRARVVGGFLRLVAITSGKVRPYFVVGFADYRYSPTAAGKAHALGASVGPGLVIPLGGRHAGVLFEVRYHSGFEQISNISHPEFVSVGAGLELGL